MHRSLTRSTMIFLLLLAMTAACGPALQPGGGDFRAQIAQGRDVLVENQTVDSPLDFTRLAAAATVAPGARRGQVAGAVTVSKCRFKGPVTAFASTASGESTTVEFAKNLTFTGCTFDEEVSFRGCSVRGLACFSGSSFSKKATFESADLTDDALFGGCSFEAEARFQNVFFRKKADFLRTSFTKAASFQGAFFALDAQFGAVKSYAYADFSTAQFFGHALFNYAEWHGRATFEDAWFKGRCEFLQGRFETASMKKAWFLGKPLFDEAKIDLTLDLADCHWAGGRPDLGGMDAKKVLNF